MEFRRVLFRSWVRAEDEPQVEAEPGDDGVEGDQATDPIGPQQPASSARSSVVTMAGATTDDTDDDDEQIIKPLPDRLVSELTAHRTLALQDAFAASPSQARSEERRVGEECGRPCGYRGAQCS